MNNSAPVELTPAQRRSNQVKLLVLWLIPVALMLIAGATYYLAQTGQLTLGSKNNGVLIRPPLQMTDLLEGNPAALIEGVERKAGSLLQGKWTMVVPVESGCDQRCRDALYLTRQLHVRLNKDAYRVQRVFMYESTVSPNQKPAALDAEFLEFLEQEHPRIATLPVARRISTALMNSTTGLNEERASFFLVDPEGWAMMYYLDQHEGNAVLADLKHLLKYSRES